MSQPNKGSSKHFLVTFFGDAYIYFISGIFPNTVILLHVFNMSFAHYLKFLVIPSDHLLGKYFSWGIRFVGFQIFSFIFYSQPLMAWEEVVEVKYTLATDFLVLYSVHYNIMYVRCTCTLCYNVFWIRCTPNIYHIFWVVPGVMLYWFLFYLLSCFFFVFCLLCFFIICCSTSIEDRLLRIAECWVVNSFL